MPRTQARLAALTQASEAAYRESCIRQTLEQIIEIARRQIGAHIAVVSVADAIRGDAEAIVSLSERYDACRSRVHGAADIPVWTGPISGPVRLTQQELEARPEFQSYSASLGGPPPPLRGWLAAPLVGRGGETLGLL
ncbi:MAG TPA: hypothetical protein VF699_04805, partial [Caulobacteraceae bacterium]